MARLTGTKLAKPRAPAPYNLWAREPANKAAVEADYKRERPGPGQFDPNHLRIIKLRHYGNVPPSEKRVWQKKALEEGKAAVAEWEENLAKPPAGDPESLQRYVISF